MTDGLPLENGKLFIIQHSTIVFVLFISVLTNGMTDGLPLENGKMYYSLVKITNSIGYTYILRSNGVTVEKNPLLPGKVYDGLITGFDLNFLPSRTIVYANWDGFGLPASASVQVDVLSGKIRC